VVMTGKGRLVEVQATAEAEPFGRDTFDQLLGLAELGVGQIRDAQMDVITHAYTGKSQA
jgi:ribonuclease PH